ncbi:MAG TPA: hypothetical protein VH414_14630 [Lichenihabitans sp.]|jgi:hypothetical protein|nr:hypothetical protein [Lichenihabitans sp.]
MRIDRRILWVILVACVIVLAWLLLDHILFPTLPMPAGAPPITK